MRRIDAPIQLAGPVVLVVLVGIAGSLVNQARALEFTSALVSVAIVVALYVFVGNSGVLSFGQVGFVIVGAYAAGEMTVPAGERANNLPSVFSLIRDHTLGNTESLVLAAAIGALFALLVGLPLMRLSGLAAGIATFAVLGITYNIVRNWEKIGPGPVGLTTVPETTDLWQATAGAVAVVCVAFVYQRSRLGRKLRAAREDPAAAQAAGIDIHRQRLWAFTLSGALSGFAGGLFVHYAGTIKPEDVYLELTFLSIAMLVIGGMFSLWGATLGALVISGLDSFLIDSENGQFGYTLPSGTRLVVVGAFMALALLFLPGGITSGREFSLPSWRRREKPGRAGIS